MASKSPNRHWKTIDWKASGQLKTLEKEQVDLLKSFSRHLNELEGFQTQNNTMTAEGAYRCFFETYDNLEDNRQQQRLLLKPKFFESFDNDIKRMLEEKSKVLRWVVDKVPDLRDIEDCRAVVVDYRKDTLQWYSMLEDSVPIESELVELEKKLKSENLSDSEKQILCDQAERFLEKRDEICAEAIRILKTENCPHGFANFSKARSHYQDLIKQYRLSKDCGNQTSLVSNTSAGDKDSNDETVIDTGNGAIENAEENAEVSSKHSATHVSRKQPSIANSRSSKRRQIEEMELENLRAKKETEQRLRERRLELEQEREEIELRRQQEELGLQQQQQQREQELQQQQQEQELRLKVQQQEDEQGTSAVQTRNRSQSPINNSRNRSAESGNRRTMNHTILQVIYQPVPSSRASGLPKLKLNEFSGDPLEWPEWSGLFDVVVHQKPISDTEKMQYLKTSLTGQAKAAISGMGFSSQSYYHARDILCEKYGRSDFIVNAQY